MSKKEHALKDLGSFLKQERKRKGLRQDDVAKKLGLSDWSSIGKWENGDRLIPAKHVNGLISVGFNVYKVMDLIALVKRCELEDKFTSMTREVPLD